MSRPDTRAVLRNTKALTTGEDWPDCAACGNPIKFYSNAVLPHLRARGERVDTRHVVANIYKGRGKARRWNRLEFWHESCFEAAGRPIQPYDTSQPIA